MSLKVLDLERAWLRWQFRTSARTRFRVYRKLEGMLRMNEALSRCLDRLYMNASEMGKYPKRPAAAALREWFLADRQGLPLAESVIGWIPSSELYMIRAGEESGTLAKALASIQAMGAKARQMREAVMYAVAYPTFMIILLGFVLWIFGVQLIQNMRKTAPPQVVDAMGSVPAVSDFISEWGLWCVAGVVVFLLIITATLPTWRGTWRIRLDRFPPWSWYRILQGSGFLLGIAALLGAQVPLKRALEILESNATPWLKERLSAARQQVLRGRNLGEALRSTGYDFPDPGVAVDLEILSERADVGSVIEEITEDWIRDQIDLLRAQAAIARNVGLVLVGGTIAWTMQSVFNVVTVVARGGAGGAGGF